SPVTKGDILSCRDFLYDTSECVAPLLLQQGRCQDGFVDQTLAEMKNLIKVFMTLGIIGVVTSKVPSHLLSLDESNLNKFGSGAIDYLRCESLRQVHCSFLMGESRVVRFRSLTIPRLELQVAVFTVGPMCHLVKQIKVPFDHIYFWTHSLLKRWIQGPELLKIGEPKTNVEQLHYKPTNLALEQATTFSVNTTIKLPNTIHRE
ncbi:hypothetical protein X801_08782, partial [Opisthorchis viverrini]